MLHVHAHVADLTIIRIAKIVTSSFCWSICIPKFQNTNGTPPGQHWLLGVRIRESPPSRFRRAFLRPPPPQASRMLIRVIANELIDVAAASVLARSCCCRSRGRIPTKLTAQARSVSHRARARNRRLDVRETQMGPNPRIIRDDDILCCKCRWCEWRHDRECARK